MEFVVIGFVLMIGIFVGIFLGIFIGMERMKKAIEARSMGRLRIDHSEPDEPARMFTELRGVTPDTIAQDKFVIFEVVNESYISHE